MEVYSVFSCDDFPSSGSITFTDLTLESNHAPVKPDWTPMVDFTDCGQTFSSDATTATISWTP